MIQLSRLSDGNRKIVSISEITGTEGDVIAMQDIFVFDREGIGAKWRGPWAFQANRRPAEIRRPLEGRGIDLDGAVVPGYGKKAGEKGRSRRKGVGDIMNDLWVTALLVFLAAAFGTLALALLSEGLRDWWRRRQVAKRWSRSSSGRAKRAGDAGYP